MEFVYFDLGRRRIQGDESSFLENGNIISNRDDVQFSPIVLWNKVVEEPNAVKQVVIVCEDCLCSEYETLCKVTHLQNVRVVPISQIPGDSRMKQ